MMNNYDKALLRFKENFTGRKSLFIYKNIYLLYITYRYNIIVNSYMRVYNII